MNIIHLHVQLKDNVTQIASVTVSLSHYEHAFNLAAVSIMNRYVCDIKLDNEHTRVDQ